MPLDSLLCFCDDCGPAGAPQSKSTLSIHNKRQHAKARMAQCIQEVGLWTLHPTKNDSHVEGLSQQVCTEDESHTRMEIQLRDISAELFDRLSSFSFPNLTFKYPPETPTAMYPGPGNMNTSWEEGPAALELGNKWNASLLLHRSYLQSIHTTLTRMQPVIPVHMAPDLASLIGNVIRNLQDLEHERMTQWTRRQRCAPDPEGLGPRRYMSGTLLTSESLICALHSHTTEPFFLGMKGDNPIVNICIFLVLVLNLLYNVTIPACRLATKILKRLLQVMLSTVLADAGSEGHAELRKILEQIPADVSTSKKHLNIMPETVDYACCPSCFALHAISPSRPETVPHSLFEEQRVSSHLPFYSNGAAPHTGRQDGSSLHSEFCNYRDNEEDGECGARLFRQNRQHEASMTQYRPLQRYSHQTLISWIARMMSRPDFEAMVDRSLDQHTSEEYLDDILQAPEVRSFLGHDGRPFLMQHGKECRLLFSLFIDWFSTRGNRRGGGSISSGVIFMACLNLPLEVRYKRENIYLAGVLPGPKAPSLQQVNHFLWPIVQELLPLWRDGIEFSRTALHKSGRAVRAALVPLVSDLGAVRKTSGTASHSATYFCTFCQLKKRDINNLDDHLWPRRDCTEFRRHAEAWKRATTVKERDRIFKAHGVRYSVLLELPYWKPTRYILLDTMHNMFLGLFQRHCRKIFGMKIEAAELEGDEEEVPPLTFTEEDLAMARSKLERCQTAESLRDALKLPMMRMLFEISGFGHPGKRTKLDMAKEMLTQVKGSSIMVLINS